MAEEEKIPEYDDLVTEEEELLGEVDAGEYGGAPTATEEIEGGGNQSDIKAILTQLRPKYKDPRLQELSESITVSRIYDDNFRAKHALLVLDYIEENQDNSDIDVVFIMSAIQDIESRAYRGMERIELLELGGIAREEEMEQIAKQLGMAS